MLIRVPEPEPLMPRKGDREGARLVCSSIAKVMSNLADPVFIISMMLNDCSYRFTDQCNVAPDKKRELFI